MDDPFNGGPRKPSKLYENYQLQTPTSNDFPFRTHRMQQSLPTIDVMFQPSPSRQDHEMGCVSHPSHDLQQASTNDAYQPQARRTQPSTNNSLPSQPRRPQLPMNNSFQSQPQPRRPQLQPLRRANTEFYPGRQPMMHNPFQPQPSQHPISRPSFPPPLSDRGQRPPTGESENPFWIPDRDRATPPREPAPTRHKRFKDSFSTIPEDSSAIPDFDNNDKDSGTLSHRAGLSFLREPEHERRSEICEECARKDRVAREYWDRNKELEEEVSAKDEFIGKLKDQRRELEGRVNELLGVIEGRR